MKSNFWKKLLSVMLSVAMLATYLPDVQITSEAAVANETAISDPGTAYTYETVLQYETDGNRYAGRVWADKSVFTDGDEVVLNTKDTDTSSFIVDLEEDESFQVIYSVLGSSMTTATTSMSTGPMDVVIVLDNSASMGRYTDSAAKYTRLEAVKDASNELISSILSNSENRLAVVTYSTDATVILPLNSYEQSDEVLTLSTWTKRAEDSNGGVRVDDGEGKMTATATVLGTSTISSVQNDGFRRGTNLQSGIDRGMQVLYDADLSGSRTPVVIVLTDGVADTAVTSYWYDTDAGTYEQPEDNELTAGVALSTLLNASYWKSALNTKYGKDTMVYGVGVDLEQNSDAPIVMNPKVAFTSTGTSIAQTAYTWFTSWKSATSAIEREDHKSVDWTFQMVPDNGLATKEEVVTNINYVDTYYNVSSASLDTVFDQIYDELLSTAFNPIISSSQVDGATGVEHTPLIYVDNIGQYMEVKEIQAVTLFGKSYGVTKNADGTYTVAADTGINPTTNEAYNTSEDILISISENADGTQKLEVEINQEILPIVLDQVSVTTVGEETTMEMSELTYPPLRVYYTVGVDSDILFANGEVDYSKIDADYPYLDKTTGEITFYSNQFDELHKTNVSNTRNAHIGFKPSLENRYYYHQKNLEVYSAVSTKDGSKIVWDEGGYGVLWEENKYDVTSLTYDDYKSLSDDSVVYTYVTFNRLTLSTSDAANAAEEVTYLVFTNFGYLKESIGFYDLTAETYINYDGTSSYVTGDTAYTIPEAVAETVIDAYISDHPNANIIGFLAMNSLRSSRFHNMEVAKTENTTATAELRYDPDYTYDTSTAHHGNDVVVWLGNNGKLSVQMDVGIALTKKVTEAIGDADDTYAITVTIPASVTEIPQVLTADGTDVTASISTYENHILTVNLKADETVYIHGLPAGTECTIDESIPANAEYSIVDKTDAVKVPTAAEVVAGAAQYAAAYVTNAPATYGNIFITKEITSSVAGSTYHAVPESVAAQTFDMEVFVGTALANQEFAVEISDADNLDHASTSNVTVDAAGKIYISLKEHQTAEIIGLPVGTVVTVTEVLSTAQDAIFDAEVTYYNGEVLATGGSVTILATSDARSVVTNEYTPLSTTVDLDIAGTKNLVIEGSHNGGTFKFLVEKWNGTSWEEIANKAGSVTYAADTSGELSFQIENVLEGITYDKVGTYAYQVREDIGNVENVVYDRTIYTFTVTVEDVDGQLTARVTDVNGNEITSGTYAVRFENTYHTAPVSIDIVKNVDNESGDATISKAGFVFKAVRTDANWVALEGAEASTLSVVSDAAGEARLAATYTEEGVYYYVLTEEGTAGAGWTYSSAVYHITVTVVKDTATGDMSASIEMVGVNTREGEGSGYVDNDLSKGIVYFANTFNPSDVEISLNDKVTKTLAGKDLTADAFSFYVFKDGTASHLLTGTETYELVGKNNAAGVVTFNDTLKFSQVGTYKYDVIEAIPNGAIYNQATGTYTLNGMTYDATIYDMVVEVTLDKTNGALVATYYFENATTQHITFQNTYTLTPVDYVIEGTKTLTGRAMRAGEFTFALYDGTTQLEEAKSKADGTFAFGKMTFTAAGTYTYIIKEVLPAESDKALGVTYTGAEKDVIVKIEIAEQNGALYVKEVLVEDSTGTDLEAVAFTNRYEALPAQVNFAGTKELVGATLTDGTYTFALYMTDHTFNIAGKSPSAIATNTSGTFAFATQNFDKAGIYFVSIVEDATVNPIENVVYDRTQHNYLVTVRDIGSGQLVAEVHYINGNETVSGAIVAATKANFTNATFDEVTEKEVYLDDDTTAQIDGCKVNEGDVLTYFITYTNYTGANVEATITDVIPEHTSYVDGSASHNGTYAGTHLSWTMYVNAGESVTVHFQVSVNETDIVVANTAVVRDGVNTYYTNEVKNHTVDEVAEKDVFYPQDLTVSIDGEATFKGAELVYQIRYINTTNDVVDVTIKDEIPKYTTYIDGSADQGGVYQDGAVIWNFAQVKAWEAITVTFKVRVNTNIGAVGIQNQAVIVEGNNNLVTNTVTNYIPHAPGGDQPQPTPTPVPGGNTPDGAAPKTGDSAKLPLWYTILALSGGAIFVTALLEKKKKEEEM